MTLRSEIPTNFPDDLPRPKNPTNRGERARFTHSIESVMHVRYSVRLSPGAKPCWGAIDVPSEAENASNKKSVRRCSRSGPNCSYFWMSPVVDKRLLSETWAYGISQPARLGQLPYHGIRRGTLKPG
jgi:hypothetical protein